MKCIASIMVGLSSAFLLGLSAYAADKTLADYKSLFEKEMSKIEVAYHASQETALNSYGKNLAVTKNRLKKTGDLDGTIAANQEIKRFEKEKTVPQEPPDGLPSLLMLVQKHYHSALLADERVKSKNTVNLIKRYLIPLEGLKKWLVQQEKLDEARMVADEIKRITFVLADIESKMPTVETTPAKPAATASTSLPVSLRKGLMLHYSFDRNEGNKVTDKSEKKNDGTVHGAKWTSKGKVGGAYVFNGRSDDIKTKALTTSSILSPRNALTIAAWIKRDKIGQYHGILHKGSFGNSYGDYEIHINGNDKLTFVLNGESQAVVRGKTHLGTEWHHVCGIYSVRSRKMKIYVDGKSDGTTEYFGPIRRTRGAVRIGVYKSDECHFDGSIDEVLLWNRALSEKEIKQLYNLQK